MKITENSLAIYRAVAILFQFKAHTTRLEADLYCLFLLKVSPHLRANQKWALTVAIYK